MPRDLSPPTTHVDDAAGGYRPHTADSSTMWDQVYTKDYADKKAVDDVIKAISSGKISDKDCVSQQALKAHNLNQVQEFQDAVNKKLNDMGSPYLLKVDDSKKPTAQDAGYVAVSLISKDTRKVADSCGSSMSSQPIKRSPWDAPIQVQQEPLPSGWPQLDIIH